MIPGRRQETSMTPEALGRSLVADFPECGAALSTAERVSAAEVPPPFCELLVHDQHMTATLERHYGRAVELAVLDARQSNGQYARKILLTLGANEPVAEFGIARVDFAHLPEGVRAEIAARSAPLGDILTRHDVLRRVEVLAYLRLPREHQAGRSWGLDQVRDWYGRLGIIHCDGAPAIELLECVTGYRTAAT